ncbi:MAG: ABC transporter permease [Desulfotalea sp.]|nr:MAG: ABC transporter permease [Desulfotalea sp.]
MFLLPRNHWQAKINRYVMGTLGLLLIAVAWNWAAEAHSGLVVAPIGATLKAVFSLLSDQTFLQQHFRVSLERMLTALALAVTIGGLLGLAAGLAPAIRATLEPLRWMLMTIPGVVIVVVFMLWFGMGSLMVVTIAATMAAPVIYIHVADAMLLVDKSLLQMARVYNFGFKSRLLRIYGMAVAGPFFSALAVAAGSIIRVVVLAEVLGANEGVGYCLAIARSRLDTPELYALALISMSVAGGLEFLIFRPLEKRLMRRS